MAERPKARTYDSQSRKATARQTRRSILAAARRLFLENGYAATTVQAIARESGVAVDTIYASVGKKPVLFRLLIETAISGLDEGQPAEERDYVQALRAEPDAAEKLRIYATALGSIQPRLAPLFAVLQAAAPLDPDLQALWRDVSDRRARNMGLLARELADTGQLRDGLSVDIVADVIWSMNSPDFYLLLVDQRGWSTSDFQNWLADAWTRLLLNRN